MAVDCIPIEKVEEMASRIPMMELEEASLVVWLIKGLGYYELALWQGHLVRTARSAIAA